MKVVIFLQNAWSRLYAGGTWPRDSWLAALQRSRSGQRLRNIEKHCKKITIWYDNTTPIVGDCPDSVIPADLSHMRQVIEEQKPDVVVALGEQAKLCLKQLGSGPMLFLPHPAYRVVTNDLYQKAGRMISKGVTGVVELKQEKQRVRTIKHG